jgi:3'-phosphoadenosine 5'-phosphosulfate sulfotransferase (PAPS reductase)/FAD synthetase
MNYTDPYGLIGKMPILASVSGGKDSLAMCLWLREQGLEFDTVFMDTGWEHPDTYTYLRDVLDPLIGPIHWIESEGMVALVRRKAMFPSRVRRFCTQELKVYPVSRWISERYEGCVINAVGIRAGESKARAKLTEWEDCPPIGAAAVWRPLIGWSEQDVIDIILRHGVPPNPLYLRGATRVGCFPCIYARKSEVRLMADLWPERIDEIRELEAEITVAADARAAAKDETNEHPRALFQWRGPGGGMAMMPIDQVVDWSRTTRGGRQYDLLGPDEDEGCMRWGLCETATDEDER